MDDREIREMFRQANQVTAEASSQMWLENAIANMRTHGKAFGYSNTYIYNSIKLLGKLLRAVISNKGKSVSML